MPMPSAALPQPKSTANARPRRWSATARWSTIVRLASSSPLPTPPTSASESATQIDGATAAAANASAASVSPAV